MNTKARIQSVLESSVLPETITGVPAFSLTQLQLENELGVQLITNVRLGQLVERLVGKLLRASSNFDVLHENVQVLDDRRTIGEIDFLLEEKTTHEIIHLELAYKFYLFDLSISKEPINNWIGPNRNDSLIEKLEKLKTKQFPLVHDERTQAQLPHLNLTNVRQELCLMVSLFVPFQYHGDLEPQYQHAIKGYYLNWGTFKSLNHSGISYSIPNKKEWGIAPSENENWLQFEEVQERILRSIQEKQCPLVWQKHGGKFSVFFVTWWWV